MIKLTAPSTAINGNLAITGSKSESNRLLLLNELFKRVLTLENISNSEDSKLMQSALASNHSTIDIHHAGTAMRFLTAFFAIQEGRSVTLTGSDRMKQRPIKVLVDALTTLGAKISYLENEGFPPLSIQGTTITKNQIDISSNVSSQYITALMLIGTQLPQGLTIQLVGKIISVPYLQMTIQLLLTVGINARFEGNVIHIPYTKSIQAQNIQVESDWSSASYYYSLIALSPKSEIALTTYFQDSLQGDSALQEIYAAHFGVDSYFDSGRLILKQRLGTTYQEVIKLDLIKTPDIAQTIAATCVGLGLCCHLTGLETLKIKETDRLVALQNELSKMGAIVTITENSLSIIAYSKTVDIPKFATYHDHRMAMCMAPLALQRPIHIADEMVVEKSYPTFWEDLKALGFTIESL